VSVSDLSGITAIAAGFGHTVALKDNATVWAWGWNLAGQLGDGTTTDSPMPVQVSGLAGVAAIAAGYTHSVALKNDATVWSWGANDYYQLGDGTITQRLTPVKADLQLPCNAQINNICYATISTAYDAAINGDTIKILGIVIAESLNANRGIDVILQGGFDATFATVSGYSSITGLTITSGSLDISGMAVQ
jgi:alpha-tubulin suppressor-like RCC1 family protein